MATQDLAPDWILKQALGAQNLANATWLRGKPELRPKGDGLTMTILGCGTMGIALLKGILSSLQDNAPDITDATDAPLKLPTSFNACVRTANGAARIRQEISRYDTQPMVFENDNLAAVKAADVAVLACRPQAVKDILTADGMKQSLAGKLLISIVAGVTETDLHNLLYASDSDFPDKCYIVRASPNIAAAVRESCTIIGDHTHPLPAETERLVNWIFTRVGKVFRLPSDNINACTPLSGAGTAIYAMIVESMASGAISLGVPREQAYSIATQTMRGTTALLQQGTHPALLRDDATTPGGGVITGLSVLEESGVRGAVMKAVRESCAESGRLER